jgi:hypothetical protein
LQTLPFGIEPFLPIFLSSISNILGAEYQYLHRKHRLSGGPSSSFHQGKRCKSIVVAEERLAFPLFAPLGFLKTIPQYSIPHYITKLAYFLTLATLPVPDSIRASLNHDWGISMSN